MLHVYVYLLGVYVYVYTCKYVLDVHVHVFAIKTEQMTSLCCWMQLLTFVVDDFRSPSTPHVHMGCPLELPGPPKTPACVSQGSGQGSLFNAMSKVKSRNSCPSWINPVKQPRFRAMKGSRVLCHRLDCTACHWNHTRTPATAVFCGLVQSARKSWLRDVSEREKKQTRASAYLNFNINCGGAAGAWRGHRETSLHADITCLQEVCMCEKERAWFKRHCNIKTYACHGILCCSVPAEINGTGQGERPTGKLGRSVVQICPHSPEVVGWRATQSMPHGFESTSMVKPRSLRVARFIGGRSIVASIIARDMGEQRLPKSNKCHARFAQCSSSSLKKCDAVGFLRVSGVTFPVVSTPHISDTTPSCFSFRGKSFQTKTSKRMETKQIVLSHIRRLLFVTALLLVLAGKPAHGTPRIPRKKLLVLQQFSCSGCGVLLFFVATQPYKRMAVDTQNTVCNNENTSSKNG